MRIELKNDTAIIRIKGTAERFDIQQKYPNLLIPETGADVKPGDANIEEVKLPLMIGYIEQIGPGRIAKKGKRQIPIGLNVGDEVAFKIDKQIAWKDKVTNEIYYLIGIGNILGIIES